MTPQASLDELAELTRTAGAEPAFFLTQKRPAPDTATCLGSGMAEEAADLVKREELDLAIFDRELSPTQIRNLEELFGVRVIDRTTLILDIFAQRARSREGKLQVELAQLRYLLPRLGGKGTALSRLGGGIGTRGPGETKLETDRRHIRRRISGLKAQLEEVEAGRELIQRRRQKAGTVTVALVGYTNAGKSTLMNQLTQAGVLAEDKLFATLDPTARALKLPCGKTVMLIDTVGLIRRLPHHLVEAFKSTLEQAATADILLNICDASSPEAGEHLRVTQDLLRGAGGRGAPGHPGAEQVGRRHRPGAGHPAAGGGTHQRPEGGGHRPAAGGHRGELAGKDLPGGAAAALCQKRPGRQTPGGGRGAPRGIRGRGPAALRPGGPAALRPGEGLPDRRGAGTPPIIYFLTNGVTPCKHLSL